MKPRVTVRRIVKSNKTPEILAAMKRSEGSYVTVGVHKGSGSYPGENPPDVSKVALWLEYGTERMPARPFLAPAMSRNSRAIARITAKALVRIAYLKGTVAQGLSTIGSSVVTMIQNVIKSNVGPALSGTYEPPKGYLGWKHKHYPEAGQRTLIASGLLLRSVRFDLHLSYLAKQEQIVKAHPMYQEREDAKAQKTKGPAKDGRDEFGRYLKKTPEQKAQSRALARKQGAAMKAQQRTQRSEANANPEAHAAAFNAQRRAFVRKD